MPTNTLELNAWVNMVFRTSAAKENKRVNSGSHCLGPLLQRMYPCGVPLIII